MSSSAKTKAKHFVALNKLPDDTTPLIEKLLLEHERDTRYDSIDLLHSMEDLGNPEQDHLINLDEAIHLVHNLKVGNR